MVYKVINCSFCCVALKDAGAAPGERIREGRRARQQKAGRRVRPLRYKVAVGPVLDTS